PGPPPDPADVPSPVGPASVAPPSTPLFPADAPTPSAPDPGPDPGSDPRQDPAPAADDPPASDDAAPGDGDGATLPAGVPIRTRDEGDAGGDLRSRLEAYLTHPEMPLVAKSDVIAKRFGLEVATADDLLHDIAAAPPDGVRLTRVRDGAWRVERRLG
ncbi:MAG: hypothetical protein RI554_07920, partial [Trueperaceae bacterium]|nr:hypothetical protein [Trueperaceae bacterium]